MNILIIGANFSNKGAEAMMLTVKQEIEERVSTAKIYMLCRYYEKELAEGMGIVPIYHQYNNVSKIVRSLMYRFRGKLYKMIHHKDRPYVFDFPFRAIRHKIKNIDIVVDVSGFAYADSWGAPMILETVKLQNFYKKDNVSFYFMPQAWGSFNDPAVAGAARTMLSGAKKFYARDSVSRQHLASVLGVEQTKIAMVHDIVFAYEAEQKKEKVFAKVGHRPSDKLLVGISPNLRVYEKVEGKNEKNAYVKLLLDLANYCINHLDADVIFIPNEMFPDGVKAKDDRYLCSLLADLVDSPERCTVIKEFCSAGEIKTLISSVDILLSSRFHALIFGFLHAKPVMAVSWSHKYSELFKLFDLEDFVLESTELDTGAAIALLERLMSEKEEISYRINARLPQLKQNVKKVFDLT